MARQRIERRLAAILAADVAGYSRLMGADEEGTLAQLNTHRRELIDPVRGAIPSSGNTRSDGGKPPQGRIAGSVTAIRALAAAAPLLLSPAVGAPQAQEQAKQHRIAIVIPSGAVSSISDKGTRAWQAFFEELRRLGDVEGQNLTVDRYSGEGRPEGYADLAREVVSRNPVVIVAANDATAQAARGETGTIPIVWIGGDPIQAGLAASLAHPGGNVTGVTVYAGVEIWGKRLQILKEASPTASKTAYLTTRISQAVEGQQLREAGERLQISVSSLALEEITPAAIQNAFGEIAQQQADAIIVNSNGILFPYRELIVEQAEKNRLPAMYPWREYVEAGGLMAYATDFRELFRRMADDVHQILSGGKPSDIPIYQPTRYVFIINLKAAKALRLTIPPALLAAADEVIE